MRLIDADELLKHKGDCYDAEGHLLYAVGTGDIINAPTVNAEPVRYGRWVHRDVRNGPLFDTYYYCTCCNEPTAHISKRCPNCGALMTGGEYRAAD